MKKKKKSYVLTTEKAVNGGTATILVYGELWEDGFVDGLRIQRVGLSRDGRRVIEHGTEILGSLGIPYARTKHFNFGWAICSPEDKFDEEIGIKIAKKRFSVSPISTQSGNLLTDDMNMSIIQNEIDFISDNFDKFYRRGGVELPIPEVKKSDIITIIDTCDEESAKKLKKSYHIACVDEVFENGDLSLGWELSIKVGANGNIVRQFNSGNNLTIKLGQTEYRLATREELEEIGKIVTDFSNGIVPVFS